MSPGAAMAAALLGLAEAGLGCEDVGRELHGQVRLGCWECGVGYE